MRSERRRYTFEKGLWLVFVVIRAVAMELEGYGLFLKKGA